MLGNLKQFQRFAGVKKKPNFSDQPNKYRPSVLIKTLRGFQFNDGDYVYKGDILVRQVAYFVEFYKRILVYAYGLFK